MKSNKLIGFLQALVILPVIAMSSVPIDSIYGTGVAQTTLVQQFNIATNELLALNQAMDLEAQLLEAKAEAIDTYFAERNMPLVGHGSKLASEAEKHGLDWRLLAAIAVRESTGGKHACSKVKYNPFGWASCKVGFDSYDEAIEVVAMNLGGNNPNTARHYEDKDTLEILRAYNPPTIVRRYAEQVISIMNTIGPEYIITPTTLARA